MKSAGLRQAAMSFVVGFLIGVVSGAFGAGGEAMFLLVLMFLLKYPVHRAIGTPTLITAMTALSGTVGYALNGNVSLLRSHCWHRNRCWR